MAIDRKALMDTVWAVRAPDRIHGGAHRPRFEDLLASTPTTPTRPSSC